MATEGKWQELMGGTEVLQPTGFGAADLEVAREQDALADGEPENEPEPLPGEVDVTASGAE